MTLLGMENLGTYTRVITVVVPVAVYFLVLGLLNSRRRPQLLSGRLDFALLMTALGPLFLLPVISLTGTSPAAVALAALAVAAGVGLLAPRNKGWVIYNMPSVQARQAIASAAQDAAGEVVTTADGLQAGKVSLHVSSFPLLHNTTVTLRGADDAFCRVFQGSLSRRLAAVEAQTSPMAVTLLLLATAMLVTPLSMAAHRGVPEIVRLLTDLLK